MAIKECRECKKEVSTEAKVCPSCGVKNPTKKKTSALTIIVSLIALFVVIGAISGKEKSASNSASPAVAAVPEAAITITSRALAKEYEQNEARADQQFKDKLLLVTGTVEGIDKDFTDSTVIQLSGTNQFLHVQAKTEKGQEQKAINLNKGQSVTVQCRGGGEVISAPMLKDCIIQ